MSASQEMLTNVRALSSLQAPWNRTSLSHDHSTKYSLVDLVDKDNSAQSTRSLFYVGVKSQATGIHKWIKATAPSPQDHFHYAQAS